MLTDVVEQVVEFVIEQGGFTAGASAVMRVFIWWTINCDQLFNSRSGHLRGLLGPGLFL